MKKTFETPIMKIITFEAQDVLVASSEEDEAGSNPQPGNEVGWSGCY